MRLINKIITVKTILFVYIILYGIAVLLSPSASAAKFIATVSGNYTYPLTLVRLSILFAVVGLFRSHTAMRTWFFLVPTLFYCASALYSIPQNPNPSLSSMTNFLFVIAVSISLTWEKTNG